MANNNNQQSSSSVCSNPMDRICSVPPAVKPTNRGDKNIASNGNK